MTTGVNISSGLQKLQKTLDGAVDGVKVADLSHEMKDYHDPKNRLTTDYGVKQNNTGVACKIVTAVTNTDISRRRLAHSLHREQDRTLAAGRPCCKRKDQQIRP